MRPFTAARLHPGPPRWAVVLLLLLLCIGIGRIAATYSSFSPTWDEPAHLATGLELLSRHTYSLETQHPPLARLAVAIGPYLAGARVRRADLRSSNLWEEGSRVLTKEASGKDILTLSRLGILPFFGLLFLSVVWFCWSHLGPAASVAAGLLLSSTPAILAHAGLATTDMALTAFFAVALFAYLHWLARPGPKAAAAFGLALGAGAASKFSMAPFFGASAAAVGLFFYFWQRRTLPWRQYVRSGVMVLAVAAVTIWAVYAFTLAPVVEEGDSLYRRVDGWIAPESLPNTLVRTTLETPNPFGYMTQGLLSVARHQLNGHHAYLQGRISETGWWYFFPIVLLVKTPLPLLILAGIGLFQLFSKGNRSFVAWIGALILASILGFVMTTARINLGIRHILPVYIGLVLLASVAAAALIGASGKRRFLAWGVLGSLLLWQAAASWRAHPDYLSYFNELAPAEPGELLIDSDLDWGQDLGRLSRWMERRNVRCLTIAYYGSVDPTRYLPGHIEIADKRTPAVGWVAISKSLFFFNRASHSRNREAPYAWLLDKRPVLSVGKSILLFHLPRTSRAGLQKIASTPECQ